MRPCILSISGKDGINYLIKTVLSSKYQIILSNNVFEAGLKMRTTKSINLAIVDIDHRTTESVEFISHLSTSSIYRLPLIILHTDKNVLLESCPEIRCFKSFQKPFNPIHLFETVNRCLAKEPAETLIRN
jgi:DNA-binding NtrC family response regulator